MELPKIENNFEDITDLKKEWPFLEESKEKFLFRLNSSLKDKDFNLSFVNLKIKKIAVDVYNIYNKGE